MEPAETLCASAHNKGIVGIEKKREKRVDKKGIEKERDKRKEGQCP
jgi:hypothetical protein